MDAVTYPSPEVARLVEQSFVPVQLNITREDAKTRETMERYSQVWTPTILVLDENGQESRRTVGFYPPEEFVPELLLGLGQARLKKGEYGKAFDYFQRALNDYPDARAAAEALYWSGVAAYKRDGDAKSLTKYWNELKSRFPDSEWWTKASFIG